MSSASDYGTVLPIFEIFDSIQTWLKPTFRISFSLILDHLCQHFELWLKWVEIIRRKNISVIWS